MSRPDPIDFLFAGMEKLRPESHSDTLTVLDMFPKKSYQVIVDAGCGAGRQTLATQLQTLIHSALDLEAGPKRPCFSIKGRPARQSGLLVSPIPADLRPPTAEAMMNDFPSTMRGVWLTGHGDVDKLEIHEDIPVPAPGPYDVLVRVAAAGVNNTDINTRIAWYSKNEGASEDASWSGQPLQFPRIQGIDVCGRIVAVGKEVSFDRIGERILIEPCIREAHGKKLDQPWFFGSECDGGFAEFTVVAARHAYRIDSDFSDVDLASFPCSYSTAETMLTRANVKTGERVLVTGASGGVGSAAVQLAKARADNVRAVTTPAKSEALRQLGADVTISRETDLIATPGANGVDVVIDLVAGDKFSQYLEVLRPGGRYAVAGAIAGPWCNWTFGRCI